MWTNKHWSVCWSCESNTTKHRIHTAIQQLSLYHSDRKQHYTMSMHTERCWTDLFIAVFILSCCERWMIDISRKNRLVVNLVSIWTLTTLVQCKYNSLLLQFTEANHTKLSWTLKNNCDAKGKQISVINVKWSWFNLFYVSNSDFFIFCFRTTTDYST